MQKGQWIITDTSTNGTFIRGPDAENYNRIPKGKPTNLPEGYYVRLSAPPTAKKQPLEYKLQSFDEEVTSPGDDSTKPSSKAHGKATPLGKGAAATKAAGNGTGGSNKRARTSLEGKFDAEAAAMAAADDHISEMLVLRENNEVLRKKLLAEQEEKSALEQKLQNNIGSAAKAKEDFEKIITELEAKAEKASEEQKNALDRLEEKAVALEEANAEKEISKSTATAAEAKVTELQSMLAEKIKQAEEAQTQVVELKASFESLSDLLVEEKRRSAEAEAACARAQATLRDKEASQAATRVELEQVGGNRDQLVSRCEAAVKEAVELRSLLVQKTQEVRAEKVKVDELRLSESSAKERERMMRAVLKEMAGLADEAATAVEKGARQMAEQEKAAVELKKQIRLRSLQADKLAGRPLIDGLGDTGGGAGPSNATARIGSSPVFLGQTQALTHEGEEEEGGGEQEQQEAGEGAAATAADAATFEEEEGEEEGQSDKRVSGRRDAAARPQSGVGIFNNRARLAMAETQPAGFFTVPGRAPDSGAAIEEEGEEEEEDDRPNEGGEAAAAAAVGATADTAPAAQDVIDLMDEDDEEGEADDDDDGNNDDDVVVLGSDDEEEKEQEEEEEEEGGDDDGDDEELEGGVEEEDDDMDEY